MAESNRNGELEVLLSDISQMSSKAFELATPNITKSINSMVDSQTKKTIFHVLAEDTTDKYGSVLGNIITHFEHIDIDLFKKEDAEGNTPITIALNNNHYNFIVSMLFSVRTKFLLERREPAESQAFISETFTQRFIETGPLSENRLKAFLAYLNKVEKGYIEAFKKEITDLVNTIVDAKTGETIFHLLAADKEGKYTDVLQGILLNCKEVNTDLFKQENVKGETAIKIAIDNNYHQFIQAIFSAVRVRFGTEEPNIVAANKLIEEILQIGFPEKHPLYSALEAKPFRIGMVSVLYQSQAIQLYQDQTPLIFAVKHLDVDDLELFIKSFGLDVKEKAKDGNYKGKTLLRIAREAERNEVASFLESYGVQFGFEETGLRSAFFNDFIKNDIVTLVKHFLASKLIDIRTRSKETLSILQAAVKVNAYNTVRLLLETPEYRIHFIDEIPALLSEAKKANNVEMTLLLNRVRAISKADKAQALPIHAAIDYLINRTDVLANKRAIYLQGVIDNNLKCIDELDEQLCTPLMRLCAIKSGELVRYVPSLIEKVRLSGADLNIANDRQPSAIHHAVETGHIAYMKALIKPIDGKSVDIKHTNARKYTVLHKAAVAGDLDMVEWLLARKCKSEIINACTVTGDTALHFAVAEGHSEIVESLLKAGAKWNLFNNAGRAPIHKVIPDTLTRAKNTTEQVKGDIDIVIGMAKRVKGALSRFGVTKTENKITAIVAFLEGISTELEGVEDKIFGLLLVDLSDVRVQLKAVNKKLAKVKLSVFTKMLEELYTQASAELVGNVDEDSVNKFNKSVTKLEQGFAKAFDKLTKLMHIFDFDKVIANSKKIISIMRKYDKNILTTKTNDVAKNTLMHLSAEMNAVDGFLLFLDLGVNSAELNANGETFMHRAVHAGAWEIFYAVADRADRNDIFASKIKEIIDVQDQKNEDSSIDSSGNTVLHNLMARVLVYVEQELQAQAEAKAKAKVDKLYSASFELGQLLDICKILLNLGAKIDIENGVGVSPFHMTAPNYRAAPDRESVSTRPLSDDEIRFRFSQIEPFRSLFNQVRFMRACYLITAECKEKIQFWDFDGIFGKDEKRELLVNMIHKALQMNDGLLQFITRKGEAVMTATSSILSEGTEVESSPCKIFAMKILETLMSHENLTISNSTLLSRQLFNQALVEAKAIENIKDNQARANFISKATAYTTIIDRIKDQINAVINGDPRDSTFFAIDSSEESLPRTTKIKVHSMSGPLRDSIKGILANRFEQMLLKEYKLIQHLFNHPIDLDQVKNYEVNLSQNGRINSEKLDTIVFAIVELFEASIENIALAAQEEVAQDLADCLTYGLLTQEIGTQDIGTLVINWVKGYCPRLTRSAYATAADGKIKLADFFAQYLPIKYSFDELLAEGYDSYVQALIYSFQVKYKNNAELPPAPASSSYFYNLITRWSLRIGEINEGFISLIADYDAQSKKYSVNSQSRKEFVDEGIMLILTDEMVDLTLDKLPQATDESIQFIDWIWSNIFNNTRIRAPKGSIKDIIKEFIREFKADTKPIFKNKFDIRYVEFKLTDTPRKLPKVASASALSSASVSKGLGDTAKQLNFDGALTSGSNLGVISAAGGSSLFHKPASEVGSARSFDVGSSTRVNNSFASSNPTAGSYKFGFMPAYDPSKPLTRRLPQVNKYLNMSNLLRLASKDVKTTPTKQPKGKSDTEQLFVDVLMAMLRANFSMCAFVNNLAPGKDVNYKELWEVGLEAAGPSLLGQEYLTEHAKIAAQRDLQHIHWLRIFAGYFTKDEGPELEDLSVPNENILNTIVRSLKAAYAAQLAELSSKDKVIVLVANVVKLLLSKIISPDFNNVKFNEASDFEQVLILIKQLIVPTDNFVSVDGDDAALKLLCKIEIATPVKHRPRDNDGDDYAPTTPTKFKL